MDKESEKSEGADDVVVDEKTTATQDDGGEKPEENQSPEKTEEQKAAHRENKLQRRFDRLTREKYEAKAEADALKKVLAMMQSGGEKAAAPVRPERNQFKDDEAWVEALTEYKVGLALQKQEAAKPASEKADEPEVDWDELVEQARDKHADYDEVLADANVVVKNKGMEQAIVSSSVGPEIAYYLAHHPAEARKIDHLSSMAAIRAIGVIEDKITSLAKAKSVAKGGKEYTPIDPVGGTGPGTRDPEKMSMKEWVEHENARMKKLNKR